MTAPRTDDTTSTSLIGVLVSVRIEALELGRHLELSPDLWPEAQAAFTIASRLAAATRSEAFR